jgi:DNA-binding response OmpR family regulator
LAGTEPSDEERKCIPVAILFTSKPEEDTIRTDDFHADRIITKTVDLDQLEKGVKSVEEFWMTVAELPSE